MRTLLFILINLAPASGAALAQPSPLTVEAAVARALEQNPRVTAARRELAAAGAGVRAARALANPSVTVTPGILGPAGSDEELLVSQPLELSGARGARGAVAEAQLRAGRSQAVITLRDLVRDVKRAYYELARAQEVLDLQQGSVAVAEEFERIARRQVELGARPGIDLTQLQVELTRARQLEIQSGAGVRLAQAVLNTLMGQPPETPLSISSLAFSAGRPGPPPAVETVLDRRAEVAVEAAQLEQLRQQARLVRTEGRPDLALSGRLESFTSSPRLGGVGLGITLPFLDYGSRRSRLRQVERLAEAQAARVEAARAQVRLDVESALTRLQAAERLVEQFQEGLVDRARRLADAERTRFTTGAGSPLTVLEAQRTYRSVLSDYYGALAAHEQAKADLEWALGRVDPRLLDGKQEEEEERSPPPPRKE